jgi:hypothetical protein
MNSTQETLKSAGAECRERVAALVRSLPGARAIPAGDGALSLEVGGRRFGWFLDKHHGDGRLALNLKAPPGANRRLVAWDSARFHVPKDLGQHGWVGIWLDSPSTDWEEIRELIGGAYGLVGNEPPADVLRENINTTTS